MQQMPVMGDHSLEWLRQQILSAQTPGGIEPVEILRRLDRLLQQTDLDAYLENPEAIDDLEQALFGFHPGQFLFGLSGQLAGVLDMITMLLPRDMIGDRPGALGQFRGLLGGRQPADPQDSYDPGAESFREWDLLGMLGLDERIEQLSPGRRRVLLLSAFLKMVFGEHDEADIGDTEVESAQSHWCMAAGPDGI